MVRAVPPTRQPKAKGPSPGSLPRQERGLPAGLPQPAFHDPKHHITIYQGDCLEIGRATPFLKWAGGKGKLLEQLGPFFPSKFNAYFEPFAGSAAVLFYLRDKHGSFRATLFDVNKELINCFVMVRDKLQALIPLLRRHEKAHSKDYYYRVRQKQPADLSKVERAARLIYLNKTCYNGLYRVNANGEFNVPIGSYKKPRLFDEQKLRAVAAALKNTSLLAEDFSAILKRARRGDFAYFDPPYHTESMGFTGYAVAPSGRAEFDEFQHRMLFNVASDLHRRGCHVVISNSDTNYIRQLYAKSSAFSCHTVQARRFINCDGGGRNLVNEFVITNRK